MDNKILIINLSLKNDSLFHHNEILLGVGKNIEFSNYVNT